MILSNIVGSRRSVYPTKRQRYRMRNSSAIPLLESVTQIHIVHNHAAIAITVPYPRDSVWEVHIFTHTEPILNAEYVESYDQMITCCVNSFANNQCRLVWTISFSVTTFPGRQNKGANIEGRTRPSPSSTSVWGYRAKNHLETSYGLAIYLIVHWRYIAWRVYTIYVLAYYRVRNVML